MAGIKCGKCFACTQFNGRNGSGYQPCHNPKHPVPPEYVPPPPLEVRWGGQHDRVLRRPVPPDVERPAIKWDDQGSGFCELEKQITILRWYNGFIVVLLIYGLFFK